MSSLDRDRFAALGLRVRVAELVDALSAGIDDGLDRSRLHGILQSWENELGEVTIDELVEEGMPTPCDDCGVDVAPVAPDGRLVEEGWEDYMVRDEVWSAAASGGVVPRFLCVGCLEARLGRALQPDDFTEVPSNTHLTGLQTPRLRKLLLPNARYVL